MRVAGRAFGIKTIGECPVIIAELSEKDWPSINDPVQEPSSIDVRFDDHMQQFVPLIPVEKADAGNILREYGNALLSPILGRNSAAFGSSGMFGQENGRNLGIMESAERSVNRINSRNAATEDVYRRLLRK